MGAPVEGPAMRRARNAFCSFNSIHWTCLHRLPSSFLKLRNKSVRHASHWEWQLMSGSELTFRRNLDCGSRISVKMKTGGFPAIWNGDDGE